MYFTIKDSLLSASAVESASSVGLCCLCRRQGSLENLYTGKIQGKCEHAVFRTTQTLLDSGMEESGASHQSL